MSAILTKLYVDKPWGRDSLPAPFHRPEGVRIGEIWFEPTAALDSLLVKYIFTSEKLSVQVHPSSAQAARGKDECWLVIDAEPGAQMGIGLTRSVDAAALREAALDGSIEDMLAWYPARAGDFFYIPAGTVHAIGAGVSLIEIQQNSDITYRLYDYGRPRELHLDEAMVVAKPTPHDADLRCHVPASASATLCEGPAFRLDQLSGAPNDSVKSRYGDRPVLVIPRDGEVRVDGEVISAGECGLAPSLDAIEFSAASICLISQSISS